MEAITCPNCNVDADPVELKQNNLRCPTCGFDLSDQEEPEDLAEDEEDDDEEESEEDKEEEEDEE